MKNSAAKLVDALQAGFYAYPLSSYDEKYSPPYGVTGEYTNLRNFVDNNMRSILPKALGDNVDYSRFEYERCRTVDKLHSLLLTTVGYSAELWNADKNNHTSKHYPLHPEAEQQRWGRVIQNDKFAFFGYPPSTVVALDVDNINVIPVLADKLQVSETTLTDWLQSCPALINTAERSLQAHYFVRVDAHGDSLELKNERISMLRHMMSWKLLPGEKGWLGDLIARPSYGDTGGKYQKLHGGYRKTKPEHTNKTEYRMVDSNGNEVSFNAVNDAPLLPAWLLTGLRQHANGSQVATQHAAQPTSGRRGKKPKTGKLLKLNRLWEKTRPTAEDKLSVIRDNLPEGCKLDSVCGGWRVSHRDQKNVAGGQVNLRKDGASDIKFHSPTVANAYLGMPDEGAVLSLMAIDLLEPHLWHLDAEGTMIDSCIAKLQPKPAVTDGEQELIDRLKGVVMNIEDTLTERMVNSIVKHRRMQVILKRYDIELHEDDHDQRSDAVVRAIRMLLAENSTYILGHDVRHHGKIAPSVAKRNEAIGDAVSSPSILRLIEKNLDLFGAPGWREFLKAHIGRPQDSTARISELKDIGWFTLDNGNGADTLALEDNTTDDQPGTSAVYTFDTNSGLKQVVAAGENTLVAFSHKNHKRFTHVKVKRDLDGIIRAAEIPLNLITRGADGGGTLYYYGGYRNEYVRHPDVSPDASPLPHPDSKSAVLLASMSETLARRCNSWVHLNGSGSAGTGKTMIIDLAKRVMPYVVNKKLKNVFGKEEYEKAALYGTCLLTDDECGHISLDMLDDIKGCITGELSARRMRQEEATQIQPFSIMTASNRAIRFDLADGTADGISRRLLLFPVPQKYNSRGDSDRQVVSARTDAEIEAFTSILAQPEWFGLDHAVMELRSFTGDLSTTHPGLLELKRAARLSTIREPIMEWLDDHLSVREGEFTVRSELHEMMQVDPELTAVCKNNTHAQTSRIDDTCDRWLMKHGVYTEKRPRKTVDGRKVYVYKNVYCDSAIVGSYDNRMLKLKSELNKHHGG